jgi:hypothetical protein
LRQPFRGIERCWRSDKYDLCNDIRQYFGPYRLVAFRLAVVGFHIDCQARRDFLIVIDTVTGKVIVIVCEGVTGRRVAWCRHHRRQAGHPSHPQEGRDPGQPKPVKKLQAAGIPNRARLSADGRMAAWTTFVAGDAYNGPAFSTRTSILDLKTGTLIDSLESFAVTLQGKPYRAVDENFWGVTFASDDHTFYATLGTGGRTWLVRGDLAARTLTALIDNVECPSLSPDGKRVVFKKRVSSDAWKMWRLEVLDLATLTETPLAEQRSIDDQAAWLDDRTVMYAVPQTGSSGYDVWSARADGSGQPAVLAPDAFSPSVTSG